MAGRSTGRSDVPRLPRGVRLRFDEVARPHVLLAPERTFDLDDDAAAVLELVDGAAQRRRHRRRRSPRPSTADREVIEADVVAMLDDLVAKRVSSDER